MVCKMERAAKEAEPCDGFKCGSGDCVPQRWVCDGKPDCPDRSDEGGMNKIFTYISTALPMAH